MRELMRSIGYTHWGTDRHFNISDEIFVKGDYIFKLRFLGGVFYKAIKYDVWDQTIEMTEREESVISKLERM